ncbi:Transcriptional regulator, TetR family [Fimbriiglobus ruber]|uniref:Transcriptional regulator, TetR family n=1 Tax=Fimbriiglobus ruber TaxID=1908690 RepID=A0A225D6Z6_9BACT|nr:Transcriptional regulator, TetR family [Fimbriiglobus ruber]
MAHRLFAKRGFAAVTTRDVARAADIATGTLFNYFRTKEAVAVALAAVSLADARAAWDARAARTATLDEQLFTLIVDELRALEPHRDYFIPVLEAVLKPPSGAADDPETAAVRAGHLDRVRGLLATHRPAVPTGPVTEHLYWSLYAGVLTFWAAAPPPDRDETLAVLDHSVRAFVGWLDAAGPTAAGATRPRK